MIEVKNVLKKGKNYLVTFNTDEILIFPIVLLKYNIHISKKYSLVEYKNIVDEQDYYFYYELALKKLKNYTSTHMLKNYLKDKNCPLNLIPKIIKKLKENKLLDDELYIKLFIESKKLDGPKQLTNKLKEKGLPYDLIDEYVSKVDYEDRVVNFINKKIKTYKNIPKNKVIQKIKISLLQKGYDEYLFKNHLMEIANKNEFNDQKIIILDYQKALRKYEKIDDNYLLNSKITSFLLQKGYNISDIKKIMNKID